MKKEKSQLSLFEDQKIQNYKADEVDIAVAEFEQNLGMSVEDYKKWMVQKIHDALRKMED